MASPKLKVNQERITQSASTATTATCGGRKGGGLWAAFGSFLHRHAACCGALDSRERRQGTHHPEVALVGSLAEPLRVHSVDTLDCLSVDVPGWLLAALHAPPPGRAGRRAGGVVSIIAHCKRASLVIVSVRGRSRRPRSGRAPPEHHFTVRVGTTERLVPDSAVALLVEVRRRGGPDPDRRSRRRRRGGAKRRRKRAPPCRPVSTSEPKGRESRGGASTPVDGVARGRAAGLPASCRSATAAAVRAPSRTLATTVEEGTSVVGCAHGHGPKRDLPPPVFVNPATAPAHRHGPLEKREPACGAPAYEDAFRRNDLPRRSPPGVADAGVLLPNRRGEGLDALSSPFCSGAHEKRHWLAMAFAG